MSQSYRLFEKFGVEMEYMIVGKDDLNVMPIADRLIHVEGEGERKNDVIHGNMRRSNELVLHVIEIKTNGPIDTLDGAEISFQQEVAYINSVLEQTGGCLLPTAMHPWMDPFTETKLWPHGDQEIYQTFDRIFDCRGHGWSNLQSTHINLPFSGDEEFRRLHSAIRVILPLLPALAASSPFIAGQKAPKLDMRLEAYRKNCARVPSITGHIVPERITSRKQYEEEILRKIERDIAPLDPEGILEAEWTNARGAIARFERGAIEIRVLDIQEAPRMDIAILQLVVVLLKALTSETLASLATQEKLLTAELENMFLDTMTTGLDTLVKNENYLAALGLKVSAGETVNDILWTLRKQLVASESSWSRDIDHILRKGSLSRRIRRAVGKNVTRSRLHEVYQQLAECLQKGIPFDA